MAVFSLVFDDNLGAFDDRALRDFLADKEVLEVRDQFFQRNGRLVWALLLLWRANPEAVVRAPSGSRRRADWRATLGEGAQTRIYDGIRRWRNERAKRDGKPAYALLTNQMLAEIARTQPGTIPELRRISGIGEARSKDYGEELLALVRGAQEESDG